MYLKFDLCDGVCKAEAYKSIGVVALMKGDSEDDACGDGFFIAKVYDLTRR